MKEASPKVTNCTYMCMCEHVGNNTQNEKSLNKAILGTKSNLHVYRHVCMFVIYMTSVTLLLLCYNYAEDTST